MKSSIEYDKEADVLHVWFDPQQKNAPAYADSSISNEWVFMRSMANGEVIGFKLFNAKDNVLELMPTVSNRYPYNPDYVVPPGWTLSDTLSSWGISAECFAERSGLSLETVQKIIRGEAAITPTIASVLARETHTDTDFWLRLEKAFRRTLTERNEQR